jgi:hypothetical protein
MGILGCCCLREFRGVQAPMPLSKRYQTRVRNPGEQGSEVSGQRSDLAQCQKRFQMVDFMGSTQEKSASKIFRFGYGKAGNDKKVPTP